MSSGYDYTGYESAFVPTPPGDPNPPEIVRRTVTPADKADNKPKEVSDFKKTTEITPGSNILNGFRSITYNFTLAGLPANYLEKPEAYRTGELDLIILKSGGKGDKKIKLTDQFKTESIAPTVVSSGGGRGSDDFAKRDPRRLDLSEDEKRQPGKNYGQEFLDDFNKFSPGRFDMFIENVEIETLMTFTENSNSTLPTRIKFEVIEPYSMNGFIETLHAAAVAGGYTSYINASFLLKLEFWGYPDNDVTEFKNPVRIPNSERYFPIGLTNVEVDISEKGTKYVCSAVPYNERAFGQPSVLKKPIKMTGVTVKQILDSFIKEFNEQVKQSNKDANVQKGHDSYEIVFRERKDGKWEDAPNNDIAKSKLLELYEDNVLYKFAQPADVNSAYKPGTKPKTLNPSEAVVNFQENSTIQDVITAVIRDSKYVRDILQDLAESATVKKNIDRYGFIDYFLVRLETKNKNEIDPNTKRPFQTYTYVITPYKVHYTRIPTYGSVQIKEEELKLFCLREYNYIYTGNNIDILSFKLNFNTLFFEAIPASLGDKNTPNSKDSVKPADDSKPKIQGLPADQQKENTTHAAPPVQTVPTNVQYTGGTAVPFQNSPYGQMARHMHEAIINSNSSMITGNIEILGDPFYLVTGGIGNFNPKEVSGKYGVVGQDEADFTKGEVNIAINFRNPIDINTFESGGMMYFDPSRVAFSGVYMVTKAASTFRNGEFKQSLEIIRKPGQILKEEKNKKVIKPGDLYRSEPNDDNRSASGTATSQAPSQRADATEIADYFDRAYPSPGLPNEPDNFTNATGGLGGSDFNALNLTYGSVSVTDQLISNSNLIDQTALSTQGLGIIGQSIPRDVSSNIRLNVSGLTDLGQKDLGSAALINAASNILTGNVSAKQLASSLAGRIVGNELSKLLSKYNAGSGIGEGKTVSISAKNILGSQLTSNDLKFGNDIDEILNKSNSISESINVKNLNSNFIDTVNRLGSKASELVNNVKDNISAAFQSTADPNASAAKLGIDSSRLSGLSSNLQSKLTNQISAIKDSIPDDVNLKQSVDAGLAITSIPLSKFGNIPPTAPFTVAENVSNTYETTVRPLTNVSNPNTIDSIISAGRLNSAREQLSKITGQVNIIDRNESQSVSNIFGSKSSKLNPLEKLLNQSQNV